MGWDYCPRYKDKSHAQRDHCYKSAQQTQASQAFDARPFKFGTSALPKASGSSESRYIFKVEARLLT
jgi:hypothetical protein